MSVKKHIYIGQYVRAKLPLKEEKVFKRVCANSHECSLTYAAFCPTCGSPFEMKEVGTKTDHTNVAGFLLNALGDEDMFYEPESISGLDDWSYFLGNRDGSRQGGNCSISGSWGDGRVSELPERVGLVGDWGTLCIYLSEHEIPYELKYGIVEYWM